MDWVKSRRSETLDPEVKILFLIREISVSVDFGDFGDSAAAASGSAKTPQNRFNKLRDNPDIGGLLWTIECLIARG
jgi:hypothetical protein